MDPTAAELDILWHTLGVHPESRVPYRNYYCTDSLDGLLTSMVRAGWLEVYSAVDKNYTYLRCTDAGRVIALDWLPHLTRSQLRYRSFLRVKDVYPDLTFRGFLSLSTDAGQQP